VVFPLYWKKIPGPKSCAQGVLMSTPFLAVCPGCSAKLKLKAAPAAGKKLKCPKCERVFAPKVPKPAAHEELDAWDLPDESSQPDVGDEDDQDEVDAPVEPSGYVPSRSRGRQTSGKKRSGKKGSAGGGEFPTKIVVGVLGVAVLIFGGFLASGPIFNALKGLLAPSVDPAYFIAGNLGVALEISPQQLLAIPTVPARFKQGPDFDKLNGELKTRLGIEIADIDVIQIALPLMTSMPVAAPGTPPGTPPPNPVRGLLRLKRPAVFASQTPTVIEGVNCYPDALPNGRTMLYCRGRGETVLFAEEPVMRSCLGAWKRGEAKPPQPTFSGGVLTLDIPSTSISQQMARFPAPTMAPPGGSNPLQDFSQSFQTNVSNVSIALTNPSALSLSVSFAALDDTKAQAFKTTLETQLRNLATQLEAFQAGGMDAMILGPYATFAKTVVTTQPTLTSNTVALTFSLPADALNGAFATMPLGLPFDAAPTAVAAPGDTPSPEAPTTSGSQSPPGMPATPLQPMPPQ
jgi:hypothetical protein